MLKYRLITAIILIPLVIIALFFLPPALFGYIVIAVCGLAGWEWSQFAGLHSQTQRVIVGALFAIGLVVAQQGLINSANLIENPFIAYSLWAALVWWVIAVLLVITYPGSAKVWNKSTLIRLIFGIVTIVPFYSGMMVLRTQGYETDNYQGAWWLLYVMLLVWGADSGAYAFGRLMGKHKMAPKVSPGKTLEGLVGGLVTAAIISWLFSTYAPVPKMPQYLMLSSVIVVLISVFGDLTESMFKRQSGIKDSSHLIPGHGGVMDRIDSLTAAIPVFAGLILLIFSGF